MSKLSMHERRRSGNFLRHSGRIKGTKEAMASKMSKIAFCTIRYSLAVANDAGLNPVSMPHSADTCQLNLDAYLLVHHD